MEQNRILHEKAQAANGLNGLVERNVIGKVVVVVVGSCLN
jgi:hypothetical protein